MIYSLLVLIIGFLTVGIVFMNNDIQTMNRFVQNEAQRNRNLLADKQRLEDLLNELNKEIEELK